MPLYPVSFLPHWRHSCLDLHLQRPKKIYEDEDVEELYIKVSTCASDCDVQCSLCLSVFLPPCACPFLSLGTVRLQTGISTNDHSHLQMQINAIFFV